MEIKFKRDTAFRKQFFVPDSFAHPAKMDAQLLVWIVEHYTKEGETILDPMAGSGTTMLGCTLGRHCILVELEEKFCKMMQDNWEQVKMRPQLGSQMGNCQIIQGDARQLENTLCDKIITSPPFHGEQSTGQPKKWKYKPKGGGVVDNLYTGYKDDNIANLPYGQLEGLVDKVITSPPYAEQKGEYHNGTFVAKISGDISDKYKSGKIKGHYASKEAFERAWAKRSRLEPDTPDNIGNLPYGQIDSIVTSPPYEGTEARDRSKEDWWDEEREKKFSGGSAKIAKGYQADSIITSPPYEGTTGEGKEIGSEGHAIGAFHYGNDSRQIGNLKSDSYLEAMLQVYQQCYKVLKPQGLMILVVKNFLREQKEVDLRSDTVKLCEQTGFQFIEEHHRILPAQSFWRVIYAKKFPNAPKIDREYVLIFSGE